ncbi:MAG TPA: hypothetical protein VGA37_04415 [Gemmatimonadales bacterium]
MARIPFTIDTTGTEFTAMRGSIRCEPPHLVIEYETTDDFTGSRHTSAPREVRVPIGDVASVHCARSWRGARLTVRTTSGRPLGGLPTARPAEVTLRFHRKDRDRVAQFAAEVRRACRGP